MREVKLTVLAENSVRGRGLLAEHGFSVLVEAGERRVLFDTGQGLVVRRNARELGVSFENIDAVVISHGHDDHTGGLLSVLPGARDAQVYLHPAAKESKFVQRKGECTSIGMPVELREALGSRGENVVVTRRGAEVAPGVWTSGQIPRLTEFEDTGGSFYLDEKGETVDPLEDDQALFMDSPQGLIVLLGCAHSGVVNTLHQITTLTGKKKVFAVIGGMHLLRASTERLERTAAALREYEISLVAAGHCTGRDASIFLANEFEDKATECSTGTRFHFGGKTPPNQVTE